MKILYVDDERSAHTIFQYAIEEINMNDCQVSYHFGYESAIEYARTHEVDCAFLDISMPGKNGIELAGDLRALQPRIEFAFITGYDDYAREAFKVGGRAYLTKPYDPSELKDVLHLLKKLCMPPVITKPEPRVQNGPRICAKTFGFFDFMIDKKPIFFKNSKSKELLAYLIHHMGSSVSGTQIFFALWERQEYTRVTSTYVRRTVRALKSELEDLGISDLLIANRNSFSIDTSRILCDAYELLNGNIKTARMFNDEYMSQYSWGETTIPLLERAAEALLREDN